MVAVHLNFKTFSKYFQNELISLFFTLFTNYKCLTGEAPKFLCTPNGLSVSLAIEASMVRHYC